MTKKYVQLTYLLSLFLILTGIVYFFASNWQEFNRFTKVGLSVGLMLLFYGASFAVRKVIKQHYFLSHWLLVAGSIGFGITIALLGQIYNWHADTYWIFGIWLVPVLIFSFITKYEVFYFASYVLFNLTFWFYMNPSSVVIEREPVHQSFIYLGFALFNLLLYWMSSKRIFHSPTVRYSSLVVFNIFMLYLSQTFGSFTSGFHNIYALAYFVFSLGLIYFYAKKEQNKFSFSITITFTVLLIFTKAIVWLISNASENILYLSLFGVFALIVASVFLVNFMNKKVTPVNNTWFKHIRKYVIFGITFIASTIGTASIIGLMIITGKFSYSLIFFLGIGFIFLALFIKETLPTVKYSIITMGYLITGVSSFSIDIKLILLLIGVLVFLLFLLKNKYMVIITYGYLNLLAFQEITKALESFEISLIAFVVLNMLVYFISKEISLKQVALTFGYFLSIGLTFIDTSNIKNIIYNVVFLLGITFMVYWAKRTDRKNEFYISLVFWLGFVAFKYYDYAWDLIDKSILLIVLGIIIGFIAKKLDKDYVQDGVSFIDTKKKSIILVIGLQLFIVLSLSLYHESVLKNGTAITLELQPLDPRSLMQGDYVALSYKVGSITLPNLDYKEKVEVLLRKDKNDIYQYANNFKYDGKWNKPYNAEDGDVIINGRFNGYDSVYYGIESFFVPEGTGVEVENEAKYALVKVGKNQNAILVDLLESADK